MFTMVTHDLSAHVGLGVAKLVGGCVFTIGLILVLVAGGELWTGNCLMVAGILAKRTNVSTVLRNWLIVYVSNFVGSLLLVVIMYYSGLWKLGSSAVGASALAIAYHKMELTFSEALVRGIGCNWLVCLAVWLSVASKDMVGKIVGMFFPVMAFVASGFEHSIANMYFVPMGIILKSDPQVVAHSMLCADLGILNWSYFIAHNLVPVTLGNLIGGGLFVAAAYYTIYGNGANHACTSAQEKIAVAEFADRESSLSSRDGKVSAQS